MIAKNTIRQRVYYSDTDHGGVAYYGTYLRWFEIGRTELLRELGVTQKDLDSKGVLLPVVEVKCKYEAPAKYDDELTIITSLDKIGNKSLIFGYEVLRGTLLLAKGHTVNVFANEKGSVEMPQEVRKKLSAH